MLSSGTATRPAAGCCPVATIGGPWEAVNQVVTPGAATFCTGALTDGRAVGYKEQFISSVGAGRPHGRRPRRKEPMDRPLPPAIVAALEALGTELADW